MSKYKAGDKFEVEVICKSELFTDCYLTTSGILSEEDLDKLKEIEPEVDWSKVEVDTPVLVKTFPDGNWRRRYFAKHENGQVYTWSYGATSWSVEFKEDVIGWSLAKLAEVEE